MAAAEACERTSCLKRTPFIPSPPCFPVTDPYAENHFTDRWQPMATRKIMWVIMDVQKQPKIRREAREGVVSLNRSALLSRASATYQREAYPDPTRSGG